MKKSMSIICSLSSGLDDMKKVDQRDPIKVLRVLAACKRYSIFEATDNQSIARTISRMHNKAYVQIMPDDTRKNYGILIKTTGGQYPWTEIELTEGGVQLLADNPQEEKQHA